MAIINQLTTTIAAGQSLSSAIDCGSNFVVGMVMPIVWTPARLTVSASLDNIKYYDLFGFYSESSISGMEMKFNVTPGTIVAVDPNTMIMARYIKLRSGTREEPVAQEAARTIIVITANQVTAAQYREAIE